MFGYITFTLVNVVHDVFEMLWRAFIRDDDNGAWFDAWHTMRIFDVQKLILEICWGCAQDDAMCFEICSLDTDNYVYQLIFLQNATDFGLMKPLLKKNKDFFSWKRWRMKNRQFDEFSAFFREFCQFNVRFSGKITFDSTFSDNVNFTKSFKTGGGSNNKDVRFNPWENKKNEYLLRENFET